MDKEKLMLLAKEALTKNNMETFIAKDKTEALKIVKELLKDSKTVTHGGSVTLSECEIIEYLKSGDFIYYDRSKATTNIERDAIYERAFGVDSYLTSSNAVTLNGELYNVDGNSNRVSAMLFGPKKVIVVAGYNKICQNIKEANKRIKEIAAPLNTKRLNLNTPCAKEGKCISLLTGDDDFCAGCNSDDRICVNYTCMAKQRNKDRVKVVLVGENLGF